MIDRPIIQITEPEVIEKGNEIGKKSLKETQENFIKGKQKVEILKLILPLFKT